MLRAFEYRLYPDEDQKILIHKHMGAVRWVYNWGLTRKIDAWNSKGVYINRYTLQKELPGMKTKGFLAA